MKVTKRIFSLLIFTLICTCMVNAQNKIEVTGKVVDDINLELIGVTVLEKGTSNGVATDMDGKYKIKVAPNATLVFSYVGMESKSVQVKEKTLIDVQLEPSSVVLEEFVAIGYGSVKRGELTSAISSVEGKDINKMPVTDALQALSGRVAGLQITQGTGAPGAGSQVKIRGGISITQSNDPLYIVDGFPSPEGLSTIEPSDIETIDILKDASATAIYGAAGANGVILITTKKGTEGKTTVNFDTYVGFKKISKRIDLLNPEQFVRKEYELSQIRNNAEDSKNFVKNYGRGYNDALSMADNMQNSWYDIPQYYGNRKGVDWQDEVFDNATPVTQNYKISINGGTKETKYNASFSHMNDDGIMSNSGFQRNNIRFNFMQKVGKLTFTSTASYIEDKVEGLGSLEDGGRFGALRQILQYRPVYERDKDDYDLVRFDVDPLLEEESGNVVINPLTAIREEERNRRNQTVNFSANVSYEIIKGLTYNLQGNLRKRNTKNDVFFHSKSRQATRSGGPYAELNHQTDNFWSYTNTLTYKPKLNSKIHSFDVMIGQEEKFRKFTGLQAGFTQFPEVNHGLDDLKLGVGAMIPDSWASSERELSFFTRMNYNLMKKYFFSFTFRADGSTKFGKKNKWGYFPSGSVAWRAIDEDFVKNLNTFSDLKVRFGVGTAGNNNIARNRSAELFESINTPEHNSQVNGVVPKHLANPFLQWETDLTINLGLEFGFFDQRLQMVVDLYKNSASKLLLERALPLASGFSSVLQNIGKTENTGVEFSITSHNIDTKDFTWSSTLNITHNKNKVVQLANSDQWYLRSGWGSSDYNEYDYLIETGNAIGHMWGPKVIGIYTVDDFDHDPTKGYTLKEGVVKSIDPNVKPGYWKYENTDGDDQITTNDYQLLGRASPTVYGGITNTFSSKGFDLSFILNYSIGGEVYNANRMVLSKADLRHKNAGSDSANRFTYINERGENVFNNPEELKRINENASWASMEGTSTLRLNSKFIESASFLRLSNITLGYTVPKKLTKKFFVNNLRLYASANNLFTITGYSGYDPESSTRGNMTPGVDWGAYPRAKTYLFGANITF